MPDPKSRQMFYVGFCRACGTGALGLRTCSGCASVVVVCDECDMAWVDEDFSDPPASSGGETLPCPHCEASLYDEPSHWSTRDEVDHCEWVTHAIDHERLTLDVGQAFTPEVDDLESDDR
ncbi:MAG: hypothetical protein ACR2NU_06420 [Aeoliella sp.]